MTITQLEYTVALDTYRHFAKAAEKCFVTQPTLSMMIQKLEEELGVKIFDRTKQPITPTKNGEAIILRARQILAEANHLKAFAAELKGEITGELHIGIIPTLASSLLPLFIRSFTARYPHLKIFVKEMITDEIIIKLKTNELDIGLLATPLNDALLLETHLFFEEFFVYATKSEKLPQKKYLLPKEINLNHLWLLEEGHCLRNQIFNLCELKKKNVATENLHYEAGSIETLVNLVDKHHGITIVPKLAVQNLKPAQKKNIREFANPKPVREISIVTSVNFPRKKLVENLKEEIVGKLPAEALAMQNVKVTALNLA
ncbi:hydrogen peroxide-inducible genes activator [Ferruginibacter albus]|uniref:hydrogen peroxide-inducible genes activator n=1 Tax=Ferruginibacter albus TaxID=2875540 RepID=UPI001CC6F6E6|nr:hydrogen peroxide-inducible genes activator [Ferruginibacter albus]UAY50943.1 LysR family transcriptional regulator [Ferruginibacter albus]